MVLLINLDLEGLEITQESSEYLKENFSYAAQEDFTPVHPFPRNAKEITEKGVRDPAELVIHLSYVMPNRNKRQKEINE